MAERKKKSALLLVSEQVASLDVINADAPGGAAYKAHMLRMQILNLQLIAEMLEDEAKPFDGMAASK